MAPMNYTTHNQNPNLDLDGCYLQIEGVRVSYDRLVSLFGEPEIVGDIGDKVQAHWIIEVEGGHIVTIYDWKSYSEPDNNDVWNIGAKAKVDAEMIRVMF